MFAKLFNTDQVEGGQVLVIMRPHPEETNPELRFFHEPNGLGVCEMSLVMKDDTTESWDAAEKAFGLIDEAEAVKRVKAAQDQIRSMGLTAG